MDWQFKTRGPVQFENMSIQFAKVIRCGPCLNWINFIPLILWVAPALCVCVCIPPWPKWSWLLCLLNLNHHFNDMSPTKLPLFAFPFFIVEILPALVNEFFFCCWLRATTNEIPSSAYLSSLTSWIHRWDIQSFYDK